MACANDRLYRRLVVEVLKRPDLHHRSAVRHAKSAVREQGAAARVPSQRSLQAIALENWMAKMKLANIPVGYLRTVEEGSTRPKPASAIA